jgi:hypothetical protein
VLSLATLLVLTLAVPPAFAQRRPRAEPQSARECAELREAERRAAEFCKTDDERAEDAREKRRKEEAEREKPTHSSFFRKFHLDGLWIPTSMGAGQYGLIGTHLEVASAGRLHFFGPPGMMLMAEKNAEGRWRIRPALTWGVGFEIGEFHFPGIRDRAHLYFNLTKTWSGGSLQMGRDLAGLSVSWQK